MIYKKTGEFTNEAYTSSWVWDLCSKNLPCWNF